jgi:hypothetical protein
MAYARIQSVAMTCHLRKLSFRDYLLQCLKRSIQICSVLLLAEYQRQISLTEKSSMRSAQSNPLSYPQCQHTTFTRKIITYPCVCRMDARSMWAGSLFRNAHTAIT